MNLLISELTSAKEENSLSSFLNAYDFISQESFVDIQDIHHCFLRKLYQKFSIFCLVTP